MTKINRGKARFINVGQSRYKRFIYKLFPINSIGKKYPQIKRYVNSIFGKLKLWIAQIDTKKTKIELRDWLIEAFIEGIPINFVVWALLGWRINPLTILAYGLGIKHIINLWWRFRVSNETSKLSYKNNPK